jgi:hypothetical protein
LIDTPSITTAIIDLTRSIGKIEGKLDSIADLMKTMQATHTDFDSRIATLELANAARTEFLGRLIKAENDLIKTEADLSFIKQRYWMIMGASGVIVFLVQLFSQLIIDKVF